MSDWLATAVSVLTIGAGAVAGWFACDLAYKWVQRNCGRVVAEGAVLGSTAMLTFHFAWVGGWWLVATAVCLLLTLAQARILRRWHREITGLIDDVMRGRP